MTRFVDIVWKMYAKHINERANTTVIKLTDSKYLNPEKICNHIESSVNVTHRYCLLISLYDVICMQRDRPVAKFLYVT